jgi:hypothetical protein
MAQGGRDARVEIVNTPARGISVMKGRIEDACVIRRLSECGQLVNGLGKSGAIGKESLMRKTRLVLLSLLAVFAFSAVAAASASAFNLEWEVNGVKLASGKTEKVVSTSLTTYTLTAGTKVITCAKTLVGPGNGTITGGKPGTDAAKIDFEECKTSETGCLVKSAGEPDKAGTILVSVITVLVEREPSGGGAKKEADEFKPASGTTFVSLEFGTKETATGNKLEGTCASFPNTTVKGQVAALTEGETLNFPSPELKGNTLEAFGKAATLVGKSDQKGETGNKITAS